VGAEVQRVSRHSEVTDPSPPADPRNTEFGRWLCGQRQLRGLSRSFVAARTRIPPERIERIERGRGALGDDALGRGTARQLALAIGADPEEALARLGGAGSAPSARAARGGSQPLALWTGVAGLVAAGALLYLGAHWIERGAHPWSARLPSAVPWSARLPSVRSAAHPGVVYRPDYVGDLLQEPVPDDAHLAGPPARGREPRAPRNGGREPRAPRNGGREPRAPRLSEGTR
jgi:transcriptional regulator with XRE-family HTH domain